MMKPTTVRLACLAALMLASVLSSVQPAAAQAPACTPETNCYPAGLACPGFALQINFEGGSTVSREFRDKNGNLVRLLFAGKGPNSWYVNVDTGKTLALPGNGSVVNYRFSPDGSFTAVGTGHTVLILFPTDNPPGPSTTLYIGRSESTFVPSPDGFYYFTDVKQESGRKIDICAELAN